MDTKEDLALCRIEKEIAQRREYKPCDGFERVNRIIDLCDFCGWSQDSHK